MRKKKIIQDFTRGPLLKPMVLFAIPFMLSNALQVLYALADMAVVGCFVGSHGLSAVSIASQAFMFIVMLCLGFSTGGQVYISQLIGSGRHDRLNKAIGTLFSVILGGGAVMTVLGLMFSRSFLLLLKTPQEAFDDAMDYMLISCGGVIFAYGYNMVSAVLRGLGDSRHPFLFIAIASVLNVILDLLFVAVLKMGVAGAALATIMGQGISFLYAIYFLYQRREEFGFDFRLRSLIPDLSVVRGLLPLGIPFAIQSCAINISMLYVNMLVNSVGYHAAATFGVGLRLDDLVNKISQGMTFAVASVVAQNMGAGNYDRVRSGVKISWSCCTGLFVIYSLCLLLVPEKMFGWFTDDPEVIKLVPVFVAAILWQFPALAIMKGTQGFIQGVGNATFSLVIALLDGFAFRIVLSWFFGIYCDMGLYGFILGYSLATYATALPGLYYYLFCKWHKRKLVTE
ncbi:MAG: MATE family efflux transporter [Lentisphaeria bacterium]|nr:MATE family efflux transporter [Lentisphaeria bacterium]